MLHFRFRLIARTVVLLASRIPVCRPYGDNETKTLIRRAALPASQNHDKGSTMKRAMILCLALAVLLALLVPALAAQTRPAKWYRPPHRMAGPGNTCPQGYSRLFGRNPPTCYRNCQQGYSTQTNHISGAACVRCPNGYFVTKQPAGGFVCTRSSGGVFGQ
jgi:hypothetical protein